METWHLWVCVCVSVCVHVFIHIVCVCVDTSIVHAFYMSQPTHVSGHEDRKHALQPGHGQDVYIGDTVFQGDAQESVEEA